MLAGLARLTKRPERVPKVAQCLVTEGSNAHRYGRNEIRRQVEHALPGVAEQEVAVHADPVAVIQKTHGARLERTATGLSERDELERTLHGLERIGLRVR